MNTCSVLRPQRMITVKGKCVEYCMVQIKKNSQLKCPEVIKTCHFQWHETDECSKSSHLKKVKSTQLTLSTS